MADINIIKSGGDSRVFPEGTTVAEAVKVLCSSKERKRTVAVRAGEEMIDLSRQLVTDTEFELKPLIQPTG